MTDAIEDTTSQESNAHLFKGPATLAALTVACFVAALLGGVGPCGGSGYFFVPPFFLFAAAAVVWFVISCARVARRTTHNP